MIRVLQVVGVMNRGGAETMIMNLYRNIDREKVQFDFVVHGDKIGDYDNEIKNLGGRIYRVPKFKGSNIIQYFKSWVEFFKLNNQYKIVHGHIGSSAAIYLGVAKKFGCYTIAHSHNTTPKTKNIKDLMYRCFSYPVRFIADQFFACGKQAGLDRYGKKIFNSNRFYVLNNAIDTKQFIYNRKIREEKRKELNIDNKFVIGHIGRFNYQKNHEFLIDIFNEVYQHNKEARLLLVGDGELRKSIEDKVSKLKLEEVVIFLGVRDDIPQIIQAMDVFVFPSHYEGLPVTVIEAQASGLNCILSNSITDESDITGNVEFISLNKSTKYWRDCIAEYQKYKRNNMHKIICQSGYDINETLKWIESFYIKKSTLV